MGQLFFIPWDTHKRHLNSDREITRILKTHPLIKECFSNWDRAYKDISNAGKGEITKLISTPMPAVFSKEERDLVVPHRAAVTLDPKAKRGVALANNVFRPTVRTRTKKNNNEVVKVSLTFTPSEARLLASRYGIEAATLSKGLAKAIKTEVLKAVSSKGKRSKRR